PNTEGTRKRKSLAAACMTWNRASAGLIQLRLPCPALPFLPRSGCCREDMYCGPGVYFPVAASIIVGQDALMLGCALRTCRFSRIAGTRCRRRQLRLRD